MWPALGQPLHSPPLPRLTVSLGGSRDPAELGDSAAFGVGNDTLRVGSPLALLLQFHFIPVTHYNAKITQKFLNPLWASLLSDFTLQSSLGRDTAFSIFALVRIPLRQRHKEFWHC